MLEPLIEVTIYDEPKQASAKFKHAIQMGDYITGKWTDIYVNGQVVGSFIVRPDEREE